MPDEPEPTPDPAPATQTVDPVTGEIHPEALIPRELHPSELVPAAPGEEEGSGEESGSGEGELVPGGRKKLWISLGVLASAAVAVALFVHFVERAAYDPARFEQLIQAFGAQTQAALAGGARYRIPSSDGLASELVYLDDLTELLEKNRADCMDAEVAVRERWRGYAKERGLSVLAEAARSLAGGLESGAPDQVSDFAVLEQGSPDHQALVAQVSAALGRLLAAVEAFHQACPAESGVLGEALEYPWAP